VLDHIIASNVTRVSALMGFSESLRKAKQERDSEKRGTAVAYAVPAYRNQHVSLHANPKPFSCEFCSKSFNDKKAWLPMCSVFILIVIHVNKSDVVKLSIPLKNSHSHYLSHLWQKGNRLIR